MTTQLLTTTLYEHDFNLWVEAITEQLKNRQLDNLDWQHLLEEVEGLAGSDKRELERRVTILLSHLLCLAFWLSESERKECSRGWKLAIREQRQQIKKLLKKSSSLKPYLEEIFQECYNDAREEVLYKSSLNWDLQLILPEMCPFTLEESLNLDYLPD